MPTPVRTPVLLFDVMSTLVYDPFHAELPAFFGLTQAEFIALSHPTTWVEFELGAIGEPEALRRMFRDERPIDGRALRAMLRRTYRWLGGIEPLLQELAAAGQPMHVLSNYPVWFELVEQAVGLSGYLPWSFVSCRTGVRKPAPEAYLGPAVALGVAASDLVLVDDRLVNCEAAMRVGLDAIRFDDANGLRRALRARQLL